MIINKTRLRSRAKEDYKYYYYRIFFLDVSANPKPAGKSKGKQGAVGSQNGGNDTEDTFLQKCEREINRINKLFSKYALYSPTIIAEVNNFITARNKLYTAKPCRCRVVLKAADGTGNVRTVDIRKNCGIRECLEVLESELMLQEAWRTEQYDCYSRVRREMEEQSEQLKLKEEPTEHLRRMYERNIKRVRENYAESCRIIRENKRLVILKQIALIENTINKHARLETVSKNNIYYYFEQVFRHYYRQKRKATPKEDRELLSLYSPNYSELQRGFFRFCPDTEENIRDTLVREDVRTKTILQGYINKAGHNISEQQIEELLRSVQQCVMQNEEGRKVSSREALQSILAQKKRELEILSTLPNGDSGISRVQNGVAAFNSAGDI